MTFTICRFKLHHCTHSHSALVSTYEIAPEVVVIIVSGIFTFQQNGPAHMIYGSFLFWFNTFCRLLVMTMVLHIRFVTFSKTQDESRIVVGRYADNCIRPWTGGEWSGQPLSGLATYNSVLDMGFVITLLIADIYFMKTARVANVNL